MIIAGRWMFNAERAIYSIAIFQRRFTSAIVDIVTWFAHIVGAKAMEQGN